MHIGFLTPEYPHPQVSYSAGLGTSLKNLIDPLLAQGYRVSIFAYNQTRYKYIEEGPLTLHLIKNEDKGLIAWYFSRRRINRYIQYFINTEKIDVLEVPDWTGISAFMKFSCPIAIRLHGSDGFFCHLEKRKQKLKNRFLEKIALTQADGMIAPNLFTLEITNRVFSLKKPPQVLVLNLGIDMKKFTNCDVNTYVPHSVYYIGTIIRKKGVFYLPRIFEEILKKEPETKFYLLGNDSPDIFSNSESTWELLKSNFSLNVIKQVTYLGKKDYDEVFEHLSRANVCIFPSKIETTGMVTLEAMAMAKAVVTSDEPWAKEIIESGVNGMMENPENHEDFANAVVNLFESRERVLQMGKLAREKIISEFDAVKISAKNLEFYKGLRKK